MPYLLLHATNEPRRQVAAMTAPRSIWGWGYEGTAIDEAKRDDYAAFLEDEMGFPERPVLEPTPLDAIDIPAPAIDLPSAIAGFCTTNRRDRARTTYGMSQPDLVRGLTGDFMPAPDAVAIPDSQAHIHSLLDWATEERIAVIPYGGGTGVVGGTEPDVPADYAGAIALDMRELNQVLEVDHESRTARIQGGTLAPHLNEQLAEHDLHLRHYPQSYEFASLGGMIATRSGGHYATRYTHIDDFVESARMLTPAGTFETRRIPASGAGPDPNRLIMGSEGTLGVITEAWMRIEPRPRYRSDAAVHFADLTDAVNAIRRIVQARLYPANCRLHDPVETAMYGLTDIDTHLVTLGFESTDYPTDAALDRALTMCEDEDGTCPDGPVHYGPGFDAEKPTGETARWGRAFMEGPYTFNLNASLCVVSGTIETAVTWDNFDTVHEAMHNRLHRAMDEACGMGYVSTRFTHVYPDGPAPYYTFTAPGEPGQQIKQWRAVKQAGLDVITEFGLTATHHHAVGRVHKDTYAREIPENFGDALRAMKRVLDPAGIMNPGVLIDPT